MGKWFRGLRLKLLLMVAVSLLAFVMMAGLAVDTLQDQVADLKEEGMGRLPLAHHSGVMKENLHKMPRSLWGALGSRAQAEDKAETRADAQAFRAQVLKRFDSSLVEFRDSLGAYAKLPRSPFSLEKWKVFEANWPALEKELLAAREALGLGDLASDQLAREILMKRTIALSRPIEEMFQELDDFRMKAAQEALTSKIAQAERLMMTLSLLALGGGLAVFGFGLWLAISLARSLGSVSQRLSLGSHSVASASEQLNAAGHSLASNSQEQAASLEETSASLEEISAMVDSNATNSEEASNQAKLVSQLANHTAEGLSRLQASMDDILASNREIESLVKKIDEIGEKTNLIDEIVFQTRLLSFNASVEAERAGEHGRGFAVVAQEVGNLAQMSGRSATEIKAIVKQAILDGRKVADLNREKVQEGAGVLREALTGFEKSKSAIDSIAETSATITRASREQSSGVKQISTAIEALNQATQQNAATSEEASASSSTLATEALNLKACVNDLVRLIEGGGQVASADDDSSSDRSAQSVAQTRPSRQLIPLEGKKPRGQQAAQQAPRVEEPGRKVSGWDEL